MNTIAAFSVSERFVQVLEGLYRAVAARSGRGVFGEAPLAVALIWVVCARVRRVETRILAMLARFRAGTLRVSSASRVDRAATSEREDRMPRGPTAKLPRSPTAKLPRSLAWLLPLVPGHAAGFASQLRVVLAEPEMVALLEASAQARRVLAPLCRMLGIEADVLMIPAVVSVPAPVEMTVVARVRKPRVAVDWGRIPIPRGVLSAVRRRGDLKG